MANRSDYRRHAMLGLQMKDHFPSNPEQLLLNDALFEFVHNGAALPSWFTNALTNPEDFENEHVGVLKRLKNLTTPPLTTERGESRKLWEQYAEWCFDSCEELWEDDPRTPRERLSDYFREEEFEWHEVK